LHPLKVSIGRLPSRELSDGVVRLRIPTLADIDRVAQYGADPLGLEGIWIPGPRPGQDLHEWASAFVQEVIAGWTAAGGIHGGGLIVDEREPFLGIVYLAPRSAVVLELSYGVAPHARGRSIATRAARLAAEWALTEGGFEQVELRIDKEHRESQRIAEKAGFRFVERFLTYIEGTGKTAEDLLYVRTRSDMDISADLSFIPYPAQRTIVAEALATAQADAEIAGLLLAGSLARGDAAWLADVDLYLLLQDGGSRTSRAELRDGILVEWHYADMARAQTKLTTNPMALYTYLDGRILYDPAGHLHTLTTLARQRFDSYTVSDRERAGIAHWLLSAQLKVVAARDSGDALKAGYIVTTTAFEVLVALWAINERPMPASGGVLAHLADLPQQPDHLPHWREQLFQGSLTERITTFEALCQWLIPRLQPPQ